MKDITTKIYESEEWNPSLNSHKKAYNDLVKWYEKVSKSLSVEEALDLLQTAMTDIKETAFYPID